MTQVKQDKPERWFYSDSDPLCSLSTVSIEADLERLVFITTQRYADNVRNEGKNRFPAMLQVNCSAYMVMFRLDNEALLITRGKHCVQDHLNHKETSELGAFTRHMYLNTQQVDPSQIFTQLKYLKVTGKISRCLMYFFHKNLNCVPHTKVHSQCSCAGGFHIKHVLRFILGCDWFPNSQLRGENNLLMSNCT